MTNCMNSLCENSWICLLKFAEVNLQTWSKAFGTHVLLCPNEICEWRFRYMKIHIFALRWKDEIRRSSQLRTLLKLVVVSRTWKKKNMFWHYLCHLQLQIYAMLQFELNWLFRHINETRQPITLCRVANYWIKYNGKINCDLMRNFC